MDINNLIDSYDPHLKQDNAPKPVTRQTEDNAFYGAAYTADDPANIMSNYQDILEEAKQFGESQKLKQVKQEYVDKQTDKTNELVNKIIQDPTIPLDQKPTILNQVVNAPKSESVKKAYLEKVSEENATATSYGKEVQDKNKGTVRKIPGIIVRPNSDTHKRTAEEQESFLDEAEKRLISVLGRGLTFGQHIYEKGIKGTPEERKKLNKELAEGVLTVGSGLGLTAVSGYAGIWKVLSGKSEEADAAMRDIQSAIYTGDGEGYAKGLEALSAVGELIDLPLRAVADLGFEGTLAATGNEDLAAGVGAAIYAAPAALPLAAGGAKTYLGIRAAKELKGLKEQLSREVEPVIGVPPESPLAAIAEVNKPSAAELSVRALIEKGEGSAKALGAKKADILQTTLLPKLDPTLKKVHPDVYDKLKALDADFAATVELSRVDPYLFDAGAIKHDKDMYMQVALQQQELQLLRSSSHMSYIDDTGSGIRGHLLFGKTENLGWTDDTELFNAAMALRDSIKRDLGLPDNKIRVAKFEDPDTGTKYLKWDFQKMYDPAVNTALGIGAIQADFMGINVTNFANTQIGRLIFNPASRFTKWIVEGPALASARSTNFTKNWNKAIREDILSIRPQQELLNAIIKTEETGIYLDVNKMKEMFPYLPAKDLKALNQGYATYRRLDDHLYYIYNETYRSGKITAGNVGLYNAKGEYVNRIGKKVDDFTEDGRTILEGLDGKDSKEIFDFTPKRNILKGIDEPTGPIVINPSKPVPFEVYRLDKPISINGKTYQYATGVMEGGVPRNLLPKIPGHYPHVNDEPYFIKAVPKKLWINGNEVLRDAKGSTDALFAEAATTVGVARGKKAGDEWAKTLQKENPEYEYITVSDRKTMDDHMDFHYESAKYAQDWAKARKKERLKTPDGSLGRLEDPMKAMHDALVQASRIYTFREFDRIFRNNWVESYGFLTEGKFPKNVEQIQLHPNLKTEENLVMQRAAVESFKQYTRQARTANTIFDPMWQKGNVTLARMLEEKSPWMSELALKMSNKREPVFSSLLKLSYARSISLNPLKQYIVQPAQLNEFIAMAVSQGNFQYLKDLGTLGPKLFLASVLEKQNPELLRILLQDKELSRVYASFQKSGIPSSIDMHAVVDGVFVDSSSPFAVTASEQYTRKAIGAAKAVAHVPRAVGFDKAELINQIGLWLWSRSDFIRKNPKAVWDDPHNSALITARALGAGNTMLTRADILPYQEGTWRFLMQFQGFMNKAVMQPFVSKTLTRDEKIRLGAIRMLMYGKRGVLGGEIIDQIATYANDKVASANPQDVEKVTWFDSMMDIYRRGLYDLAMNGLINLIFSDEQGAKTDLALSAIMSPTPDSTVPVADLVLDIIKVAKQDQNISQSLPFVQGVSSLLDTANVFYGALNIREREPETKGEALAYLSQLGRWAAGWNSFEKALAMKKAESLVDKFGNSLEIRATMPEIFAEGLGVHSKKYEYYYDIMSNKAKLNKEIKASATKVVESLQFITSTYGQEPNDEYVMAEQLRDRVNSLIEVYATSGLDDDLRDEIYTQLSKTANKGLLNPIRALLDQKATTYKGYRREIAEKMNLLMEISGEDAGKQIKNLYYDMGAN